MSENIEIIALIVSIVSLLIIFAIGSGNDRPPRK